MKGTFPAADIETLYSHGKLSVLVPILSCCLVPQVRAPVLGANLG